MQYRRGAVRLAVLAPATLIGAVAHAAVAPALLRVCIDKASATAGRDRDVATTVAGRAKLLLSITPFDGAADDDGVPAKTFRALLTRSCDLVMGYPVDASAPSLPPGLLATKPYAQTGFVLVTAPGITASTLADLPAGTDVAVTYGTSPNLYFADHGNVQPDIHTSDADTVQAVASGTVKAAMVWQATVDAFQAHEPASPRLGVHPLHEPHARYDVVALYLPQGASQAGLFDATKISVDAPAPGKDKPSALYTATQAKIGYVKYLGNCAMCHGTHLEGRSGPALKGPNWANEKAAYTVGEVFTVISQQMPAISPGTLPHADYAQIMAYLLQQNGYPAGSEELTFEAVSTSKEALLFQGK